ncbi:hypothetical protein [Streptomyces sp. NPDC018693]|uniref:hypothetical protein n=1 Tax=unclassified Streptomyces TaxID=2593676 RepID=UPI0037959EB9
MTSYIQLLWGHSYSYYPVGRVGAGNLGTDAVRATDAEREEWRTAAERLRERVAEAERACRAVTHHGLHRYLPGARRRMIRAKERFRAELAAAEGEYLPVRQEIERRLAAHKEEERLARETRRFRWEAEQLERRRNFRERQARYRAMAKRAVWGWGVGAAGTTVYIHRHDVPLATPQPLGPRRSEAPLTARDLETDLVRLGQEGIPHAEWDEAAQQAVATECSAPDNPASFEEWWLNVTDLTWRSPKRIPPPRPPQPPGRGSGSQYRHGPSGSDYGGIGGDFGGGYGGSFGGFGGGY